MGAVYFAAYAYPHREALGAALNCLKIEARTTNMTKWSDAEAMAAAYAPDATFPDPVFQGLTGAEVPAMWRMLAGRARDLTVSYHGVQADDARGQADWEATYN
jgi:hypothetical protein